MRLDYGRTGGQICCFQYIPPVSFCSVLLHPVDEDVLSPRPLLCFLSLRLGLSLASKTETCFLSLLTEN